MSKHHTGRKITRTHTSAISAAIRVIRLAESQAEVSKIRLAVIRSGLPPGKFRVKCNPIQGGIKVTVRGVTSVQSLYIYTSDQKKTEETLMSLNQLIKASRRRNQ